MTDKEDNKEISERVDEEINKNVDKVDKKVRKEILRVLINEIKAENISEKLKSEKISMIVKNLDNLEKMISPEKLKEITISIGRGIKKDFKIKEYVVRLVARVLLLLVILCAYIWQPHYFDYIVTKTTELQMEVQGFELSEVRRIWQEQYSVIWIYIVWMILMISMLVQMFSIDSKLTMGSRKVFKDNYEPVEKYDRLEMYEYNSKQNLGALKTLLAWAFLNAIFGALYVFDFIGIKELVLLCACYYVCDLICVVIWCPFQRYLMKNRCCVNCRIFNWGWFMIFTPFVFIRNFFTWSLFFMSLLIVIRWEWTLIIHPERFWFGSNDILKCENCKDKICQIKGKKLYDENGKLIKIKK